MIVTLDDRPAGSGASVRAVMNYLGEMDEVPGTDENNPANDRLLIEPHEIQFYDARPIANEFSLDVQGFKLIHHETAMRNFYDPVEGRAVYLREMEKVVQQESGADYVISTNPPVLRLNGTGQDRIHKKAGLLAHCDFTSFTVRTQLGHQIDISAPVFSHYKRIVVYQTWRALSPPPQDSTLTLCDTRTVSNKDRIRSTFTIKPSPEILEYYICRYNPAHRWFYFPDLQRDELLIFKGFDGNLASGPNEANVPHSAFDVPGCPVDIPPRESVETRTFAFFRD